MILDKKEFAEHLQQKSIKTKVCIIIGKKIA